MSIELAEMLVLALGIYFGIGFLIAALFVFLGAGKIDPAAKTMPLQARMIILPGTMLLWPLMAAKWATQKEPPLQ
ncbi:MAG: hypothetical protein AAFX02_00755 [Pseudomonadota bacterium]